MRKQAVFFCFSNEHAHSEEQRDVASLIEKGAMGFYMYTANAATVSESEAFGNLAAWLTKTIERRE